MTGPPLPVLVTDAVTEFSGPGCPVCRYTREADERFFTWFALDNGIDPTMIARLQASGGMCPPHTRRILAQPAASSRLTIVYRFVLPTLRDRLAGGRPPNESCPACRRDQQASAAALHSLARALTDQRAASRYAAGDGLCLPHLRQARGVKPPRLVLLARTAATHLHEPAGSLAALAGLDPDTEQRRRLRALLPPAGMLDETPADPADTPLRIHQRLRAGSCPICLAEGQHERRYLGWLCGQVRQDPAGLANEPGGLCPRHLHDLAATDTQAGAWATRREQLRWVSRFTDALIGSRRRVQAGVRRALHEDACLVCRAVADAVAGETAVLLAALAIAPLDADYPHTAGVCLRHADALPASEPVRALIRRVALARTDLLIAELNEAARKSAWLSRHESRGPESTAWLRAAARIDGRVFLGGAPRTGTTPQTTSDQRGDPPGLPRASGRSGA